MTDTKSDTSQERSLFTNKPLIIDKVCISKEWVKREKRIAIDMTLPWNRNVKIRARYFRRDDGNGNPSEYCYIGSRPCKENNSHNKETTMYITDSCR